MRQVFVGAAAVVIVLFIGMAIETEAAPIPVTNVAFEVPALPEDEWVTSTMSYNSHPGDPTIGHPLKLTFSGTDEDVAFDNVWKTGSAVAVPIPPAVWLLGAGLIGLIGVKRREGKK